MCNLFIVWCSGKETRSQQLRLHQSSTSKTHSSHAYVHTSLSVFVHTYLSPYNHTCVHIHVCISRVHMYAH